MNNKMWWVVMLIANTINFCAIIQYFDIMQVYEIFGLIGMYGWSTIYLVNKYRNHDL